MITFTLYMNNNYITLTLYISSSNMITFTLCISIKNITLTLPLYITLLSIVIVINYNKITSSFIGKALQCCDL